jgi:hypothetical protein
MDRRIRIIPRRIPHRGWFFRPKELIFPLVERFKSRDVFFKIGEDNELGTKPNFFRWGMIRYVHLVTAKIARVIQLRSAGMMGEKMCSIEFGL